MKKKLLLIGLVLIMAFAITACGTNANNGDNGNDANANGNGADATTGLNSLEVTEAISAEWLETGKADTSSRALVYAGIRGASCAPCHSGNTFETGVTYTAEGIEGHPDDRNLYIVDTSEADLPSTISCATCHTSNGGEALETGLVDVPWAESIDAGGSALCLSCHNGRRDVVGNYEALEAGEEVTAYPHYAAGLLASGMGGMEYPDVDYASTGAHASLSCNDCHMAETDDGYKSHTFEATLDSCTSCHGGATDYNINGFQDDIKAALDKVETAVLDTTGGTAIFENRGTVVDDADEVSKEAYIAAYNWKLVKDDGALYGAHNPGYAKSLLEEAYKELTGDDLF